MLYGKCAIYLAIYGSDPVIIIPNIVICVVATICCAVLMEKSLSFANSTDSGFTPQEVHASQGLKVGLYTPAILGWYSYLSWFYDRGAMKDPARTGTSKGLSQAINRGPVQKFLPKYASVYVTIQSHGLSAGERTHCVTANEVRNGLRWFVTEGQ